MPNESFPMVTAMIDIAIIALAKRTDPLTARVNAGDILTTSETKQILHDLFNLASLLKTSAQAIDIATAEITDQDREIATMKALLGLSDTEKSDK